MPFSGKFDYWQNYGDEKSRRSIPVIGEKGYSVWSIIGYYKLCKGNREQLLVDYGESLTAEELEMQPWPTTGPTLKASTASCGR